MRKIHRIPSPHARPVPGFTLVELLVVIGIIAILVALLLPMVSSSQQAANQVKCAAQISQIIAMVHVHSLAHRGYAPLVGLLAVSTLNADGFADDPPGKYSYINFSVAGEDGLLEAFSASLARELGDSRIEQAMSISDLNTANSDAGGYMRIFRCPADMTEPGLVHQYTTYAIDRATANKGLATPFPILSWADSQSYIYNEAALGWNDALTRSRGQISRIRDQSETMLMADGIGGPVSRGNFNFTTIYNKIATGPVTVADALAGNSKAGDPGNFDATRHRAKMNVGFFDGHVEARSVTVADLSNVYLIAP